MKKALIIGSGYTGSSLSLFLKEKGIFTTVTTRTIENLESLKNVASNAIIFHSEDQTTLFSLLREYDYIFLIISADTSLDYEKTYLQTAKNFIAASSFIKEKKFLLYTSSTSVYAEQNGHMVNEDASLDCSRESALILQKTESTLLELQKKNWDVCILRLSEIYGKERSIKRRIEDMEGKEFPGDGQNFSNMIHVEDIIRACYFAAEHRLNGIYNLSDDDHLSRKELYEIACKKYGLPNAQWNPKLPRFHGGNKIISNEKIKRSGFQFTIPHRFI